jgi:hypothetical protein
MSNGGEMQFKVHRDSNKSKVKFFHRFSTHVKKALERTVQKVKIILHIYMTLPVMS